MLACSQGGAGQSSCPRRLAEALVNLAAFTFCSAGVSGRYQALNLWERPTS